MLVVDTFGEEADSVDDMAFTKPEFSKGQVRRAGKILTGRNDQGMGVDEALQIASNWRSSHAYPTWVIRSYLHKKLSSIAPEHMIASRTKKMPTIVSKLFDGIVSDLSTMQDIGGCRVIVDNIEDAFTVASILESGSTRTHRVTRKKDYFSNPKDSGYRGIHLISKYDSSNKPEFKGMQVETQVRTKLVHSWATTVEVVDLMNGSTLKRSHGSEDWKRFFFLVADHISRTEGTSRVIPDIAPEVVDQEIRSLEQKLHVWDTLDSWEQVNKRKDDPKVKGEYFVIVNDGSLTWIRSFPNSLDAELAYRRYELQEDSNAVSVAAEDIELVTSLYPNYFMDSSKFREYISLI